VVAEQKIGAAKAAAEFLKLNNKVHA